MDTRIRIIAEDITKDGVNALNRLIELERQLMQETEAAKVAQENSNKATNQSIGIIKNLQNEVQRLIKLRNDSTDTTQIASYNRQIGLQEAELKKLTDTQQKSNILSKEQNAQIQALTANAGQSNSMFRNLAATMIGLYSIDKIVEYSKNLLDTAINSQRLDIALKNVSTSNAEYSKSVEYLNEISNKYGQNVNNLKETYTQFIAASKTSNLSLQERQRIYESVIQAGSTLQRSNEQIERSLNAVTQMFSKGCHGKGSKIRMSDGSIKLVEQIKVGDYLMGEDYLPKEVLKLENGNDILYKISPRNGINSFIVNQYHKYPSAKGIETILNVILEEREIVFKDEYGNEILCEYENLGIGEYFGFAISGNHLYLDATGIQHHNTVSAEELRQQLGEQLPGAFGIMAKALNVSEKQLNKMLEQGEVLAKDALPKFAAVLTEMYGDKAQNNVNTWAGGLNRATNSLTAWVNKTNESLGITEKMAKSANWVADNFGKLTSAIGGVSAALAVYTLRKVASNTIDQIKLINLGREVLANEMVAASLAKKSIQEQIATIATLELTAAEKAAAVATVNFNSAMSKAPWGIALVAIAGVVGALLEYSDRQKEIKEKQDELNKSIAESQTPLKQQQLEFNNLAKEVLTGNLARKDELELLNKLKKEHPKLLSDVTDLSEAEKILNANKIKTNSQYDYRVSKFNELKSKFPEQLTGINNLEDAEKKLGKVIRDTNLDFILRAKLLENEVKIKYNNELATKAITEQIEIENKLRNASTAKGIVSYGGSGASMGTSSNYAQTESEFESLTKLLNKKKEQVLVYQKANADLAEYSDKLNKKLVFDYDSEIKASGKTKDAVTKDAKDKSAAKKTQLEKDQEENEKAWASFLKTLQKAMKDADEIMRKPFDEQYKRLVKQSKDEKEAADKTIEAKRESFAEGLKLQAYYDMLEKVENAKTLKEIENAENEYSDKILKIDTDLLKEKIKNKKQELLLKKSSGALELADEEKLKEEIAKLEKELTSIKRKEGETQIKNKKDDLKTSEDIEKEYQKRRKKALDEEMDFELIARKTFNKSLRDLTDEEYQQLLDISENKKKLAEQFKESAKQSFEFISNFILDRYNDDLEEKLSRATSITEKAAIEQEMAWLNVGKSVTGAVNALAQGNYVGAIVGGVQSLFQALDTWVMGAANEQKAKMEQYYEDMKKAGEEFMKSMDGMFTSSDIESIKSVYGGLIDTFNTTLRLDFGEFDNAERRLQQEILIGQQIVENYNKAVTNENDLHSKKIDNINSEYNASVKAINDKYNLEKSLADTAFGAASLAIQEQTNQQLMALLTNQDTRLSLDADYNAKRQFIFGQYADQIKPITEGMTQAEIDGINAAIQARDNALSEVEKWLQDELKFVLTNEEQKRKEYSATEKIIKDGEDAIEALRIEYNANELERVTNKNLALESAEKAKNANIEIETQRHNDSIVAITKAKDEQLAESFKILQDIIKNGYDEIMAKALEAVKAGKITSDQYNEIANRLFLINSLINGLGDWKLPDINWDNFTIPRFNTGTEIVGGKKGIDKNLALLSHNEGVIRGDLNEKRLNAGLDMHKTIEYAINYKSILDSGLQPLKIKESALNKLDEHAAMQYLLNFNMRPVVEELKEVKSVLSKIPIQNFNLDEKGLSKYVETKNNVTKFKNKRLK